MTPSSIARVVRRCSGALVIGLALVGPSRVAITGEPPGWEYAIDVAADLSRLDVRIAFSNFEPLRLALADGGPLTAIRFRETDGADVEVEADQLAVRIASLDTAAGLAYGFDLAKQVDGVMRVGGDLVTQTGDWLLRPLLLPEGARFTAVVRTPAGVRFTSPWPVVGTTVDESGTTTTRCRFDRSTWNMVGHAVFGRFAQESLSIAGTTVDLVTLSAPHRATAEGVRRWIRAAVEAIALLYGRFPVPRVSVYVLPVPGTRGDPVSFGSTWYGGGPHVLLYLANVATDEDLVGEWVALHELLHTTMPSIAVADAWLSEGFVTYYQEVLRARARFHPPARSWQLIEEGFGRGRKTGTGAVLAKESADMRSNHAYFRVYWSGAAIALMLDVEVRRTSGGRRSLDDVMRHWAARAGNESDVSADELIADADRFLGAPLLSSIAGPRLASKEFPAVDGCYQWLGLGVRDGRVFTISAAEGAADRERIVSPPPIVTVPAPSDAPHMPPK